MKMNLSDPFMIVNEIVLKEMKFLKIQGCATIAV